MIAESIEDAFLEALEQGGSHLPREFDVRMSWDELVDAPEQIRVAGYIVRFVAESNALKPTVLH